MELIQLSAFVGNWILIAMLVICKSF